MSKTYPGKKSSKSSPTYPGAKNGGGSKPLYPVMPCDNPYRGKGTVPPKK